MSFFKDMKSLVTTIEDFGNPFLGESEDLIVMDTKEIAGPAAVTVLCQIEAIGKQQCNQFITERLLNRTKSLYDPIKRNKVSLFNSTRSSQQRFHEIAHAHSWSILCLRRHFGKAGLLAHHNPVPIFTIVKLYFLFIIHRQSLRSKVYNCRVFSFTKNAYAGFRRT